MYYPGAGIDFIKDRLEVANGSRGVIFHVGGNIIRSRDGTFERTEILLRKYRELLVRAMWIWNSELHSECILFNSVIKDNNSKGGPLSRTEGEINVKAQGWYINR